MRVVLPAVLDSFACADGECPCRVSLRSAPAPKSAPRGRFPYRDAEEALVEGASRLAAADAATSPDTAGRFADYPILAIATPQGVELNVATLCPTAQALLASNDEAVALARSEGGWRVALQVFHPADGLKEVRLTPRKSVSWNDFAAMRDALLDRIAEPTLPLLARLAQVAGFIDAALAEKLLPVQVPPLTARGFLAFRGYVESRTAAAEAEPMARFAARSLPLWGPRVGLTEADLPALRDALAGDWRSHFRTWLVPAEREIASAVEAYLGARLFSIPLDRDQSIARGYAEFFEAFAVGLRYAAAIGQVRQRLVDPAVAVAALALGEHHVALSGAPLPAFELPRDVHERGPRMADLDMTLESIC